MLGLTALLIGGFVLFASSQKDDQQEVLASLDKNAVAVAPEFYDLGDVPINGGIVQKVYEVKNTSDKTIKIKKIATSCMCTKAKLSLGGKETGLFGMEGHGNKNPPISFEIPSGETARVVVDFDPAAHGPAGVGPIDRSVFLTFSNPAGVKELKFNGVVK